MNGRTGPRYLFRYRDLVAATLPEHRQVLQEQGQCWWGWWKRPNEPGHLDVWTGLQEATRDGGSVQIGLFHSGTGEAHIVTIDQVILPQQDEYGQFVFVSPPEDQKELIPAYYRFSHYSRGWLRVISIANEPFKLFNQFSYAKPPPLPDYLEDQLARLEGKRIVDPDELRAMDTTIWEIRPTRPTDSSERFLAATPRQKPISAQPVSCPGEWLLHLTDPHYAVGDFREEHQWRLETEKNVGTPTMVDAISDALQRERRTVGAVVVTGDLTYIAAVEEFEAAAASLFKLTTGILSLGMEHLVVIPGNHDIGWTRSDTYEYETPVEVAPEEATANYRSFFKSLYRMPASDHLSMARRFVFPGGNLVDVVGVNSSSLEQGQSFLAGMGRVQEAGYREAAAALNWSNKDALGLRVLALHHHLALTEDLESPDEYRTGFGIAIDAPRVQRMAAQDGVHLAVHGHKHRAFVWRTGAYQLPEYSQERWELGSFNIVGGGSSGSRSTDGQRNFFNLIQVRGPNVILEMYRSQRQGSFERFMTWRAPLTPQSNIRGLAIGPWERVDAL
jgi:3',5'-cyclic AMP phosphodiesterase CpdA